MKNESHRIPQGLMHFEWFLEDAGILRFFRDPIGELDFSTGQPLQDFEWCCTLWRHNGTLWIKGVMSLPELPVVRAMIRTARKLPRVDRVAWDTLDSSGWAVTRTEFGDRYP